MIQHNYPGKFIVIEGLDGSGKSTHVDLLVHFLEKKGKKVLAESEPTKNSEAGKTIRRILKGELAASPMERQNLFVEDRKEHLQNIIIPALKAGQWVVCSRYAFSTIAYGHADGLDVKVLVEMNEFFLLPDVTMLIDVSPEECIARIEKRGQAQELFERKEKLIKVNEVYQKLPGMFKNIFVVNGEESIQEVFENVKNVVESIL